MPDVQVTFLYCWFFIPIWFCWLFWDVGFKFPLDSLQIPIVEHSVEGDMKAQSFCFLSRAPGFSKKPIYISSQHGAGVIKAKKWVKADLFKLSLSCN